MYSLSLASAIVRKATATGSGVAVSRTQAASAFAGAVTVTHPGLPCAHRHLTTPPVPQPHLLLSQMPKYSVLRPVASRRLVSEYKRQRNAAVDILKRHFRQSDIINPQKPIDPAMVNALQLLGFKANIEWTYNFGTVQSILAFLHERSNAQWLYNLTSLSAALFVAFTTWYYANEAKEREEARIADEESRKKWDSLFDISVTRPESEPFSIFTDGAPWCKESRTIMDDLRKIIESPQDWKHGSSYFHVLFGPQGTGKSQILKLLFNESLAQLKRDPASNQSIYYIDLKDAFLTNCTDSEFVSERFLDFLDEIQNKAKSNGTRITLFVDTADCMSNVFPENRLAAVVRHLHETGKFAHVFLAFNDHRAYTQLLSGQPGLMEQHGFLNVPFLSSRKDLLAYVKQIRVNVVESGHGQLWDVPEEALVEILGGHFADYGRVQRNLVGGRGLLSSILKDLLSDSQERVERALCFYREKISPLACSFLVTAEALLGGAKMVVPAHVQKQLMNEGLMYRCQSTMSFMFPRDRVVMDALLRNRVHAKHLNLVRKQAKVRPLVLHAEPPEEIVEHQAKRAERSKRAEVLKSWIWWPWGRTGSS